MTYPYVLETGFMGKYASKKNGPRIAFLCEYDALPEVGHGCGHNLIAGIGIAAARALCGSCHVPSRDDSHGAAYQRH